MALVLLKNRTEDIVGFLKTAARSCFKNSDFSELKPLFQEIVLENKFKVIDKELQKLNIYFSFQFYFVIYLFEEGELEKYKIQLDKVLEFLILKRDFKNLFIFLESNRARISNEKYLAYQALGNIQKGEYDLSLDLIESLKQSASPSKFNKILNFLSANINFEEAKRLESLDLIDKYLEKKLDLVLDLFSEYELEVLKKNVLRLYVNKIVYGFEQSDYMTGLLNFLLDIKEKELGLELITVARKKYLFSDVNALDDFDYKFKLLPPKNALKEIAPLPSITQITDTFIFDDIRTPVVEKEFLEANVRWKNFETAEKTACFNYFFYEQLSVENYNLCLKMIVDAKNEGIGSESEVAYLESIVYLELKNFIQAQITCENLLSKEISLNTEEEISIKYLLAESLFFQGKMERALQEYRQVIAFNPMYRLAKERINAIEQSK